MKDNQALAPASEHAGKKLAKLPVLAGIGQVAERLTHTGEGVETSFETPRRIGLTIAFLVFGVFGLWATLAPLGESAHAGGFITVSSYNKVIQHLEGGIVQEIRVQNGDTVQQGDVLLVLDPTQSQAQLDIIRGQLLALSAKEARLLAERDGLEAVSYPDTLRNNPSPQAAVEIASQEQQFRARKAAHDGAITILEQRINQLQSLGPGLQAMRESKNTLAASFGAELADLRTLLDKGYENIQQVREIERNHAMYIGEAADLTARIASNEIEIGRARAEILQLQNEFQKEVANELSTTQTSLQDARERITALTDVVTRTEVRATATGMVNGLQFHTEGGVIGPGTTIAEIIPQSDDLIIEARVSTLDIDRVAVGQEATIRLDAFSSKGVPTLYGTVLNLSGDAMVDENTGASFYQARVAINPESLADLEGLVLVPGMPAQVFIATGTRTFLDYLLKPLSNAIARSFNED